jgi:hypothetical protein
MPRFAAVQAPSRRHRTMQFAAQCDLQLRLTVKAVGWIELRQTKGRPRGRPFDRTRESF